MLAAKIEDYIEIKKKIQLFLALKDNMHWDPSAYFFFFAADLKKSVEILD